MTTRIDLFDLHDYSEDTSLKKCVMAKGENLKKELLKIINSFKKIDLTKELMKEFKISQSSAERLVFLNKNWIPLFYIEYLLKISNNLSLRYKLQDEIEFLKANQSPQRMYKAVKFLTPELCKIIGAHTADGTLAKGNLIRITDGYEKNIDVLKEWFDSVFKIDIKKIEISPQEWGVELKSKIIARYLHKIFDFPYGCKQYTTREPLIIKNSSLENRKSFALGALTFEAGVGIKHQVELCVSSKCFRNDLSEILNLLNLKHKTMQKQSSGYWRLWSNSLTKEQAKQWMSLFAEGTEKWLLLKKYSEGFQKEVKSFEEAIGILDKAYPSKSASKVCLKDVLEVIKDEKEVHRYQLANRLCDKKKISSYGGKWAHSLKHYLEILKIANIITIEKRKFGKKKSFGSIVREVYIFNNDISSWRLP